jgi:hypothetical protein
VQSVQSFQQQATTIHVLGDWRVAVLQANAMESGVQCPLTLVCRSHHQAGPSTMDSSCQRIRIGDLPTSHTHTSRMTHGTPPSGTKVHAVVQPGNEEVVVDSSFESSSRSESQLLQYHMDMIGLHEFIWAVVSKLPMKDEETIEEMKNPEGPMLEQPLAFIPLSDNMAIESSY